MYPTREGDKLGTFRYLNLYRSGLRVSTLRLTVGTLWSRRSEGSSSPPKFSLVRVGEGEGSRVLKIPLGKVGDYGSTSRSLPLAPEEGTLESRELSGTHKVRSEKRVTGRTGLGDLPTCDGLRENTEGPGPCSECGSPHQVSLNSNSQDVSVKTFPGRTSTVHTLTKFSVGPRGFVHPRPPSSKVQNHVQETETVCTTPCGYTTKFP